MAQPNRRSAKHPYFPTPTGNANSDFPHGTSVFEGIRRRVEAAGGRAILATDDVSVKMPAAAIVVFGEDPYAEFQGDLSSLAYKPGDDTDYQLLKRFYDAGIPTVAVFLSGRPLWVNREINACHAFVAVLTSDQPIDLSSPTLAGMAVRIRFRVDEKPTQPVTIAMRTATHVKSHSFERQLAEAPLDQWQQVSIPLSVLSAKDTLKSVTAALVITTGGRLQLSISDVELVPGDE